MGGGRSGLALAVVSAATFGTSGTFATALIHGGWSPGAAVLARIAAAAAALTLPALLALRGRWPLLRRSAGQVIAFGLFAVAGAQLCYFNAIQRIPVGVALLLEYLGVILVVGWMWLRHGQRPRRLTVAGAVTAIAGLGLVLDLSGKAALRPAGVMWGLLAAVGLAVYFVLSASDRGEQLPPLVMAWGGMCAGGAFLALLGAAGVLPMTAQGGPGARARAGRGGGAVRGGDRGGSAAGCAAGLVLRSCGGAVRGAVRVAGARPAARAAAVRGRRADPGRRDPGPDR
jgi:drug/metabolite transporter (DMT)-like permease